MKDTADAGHLTREIGRRTLIVGGAALWGTHIAHGAPGRPLLGILCLTTHAASAANLAATRDGLRSVGYVEGQTLDISERDADGDQSRLPALAQDLLRSNPDVVLAVAPPDAIAAKSAAPSVPIVCPTLTQALIPQLISSYAHPGGSVTGIAVDVEGMYGKLVELIRDAIPGVRKIGLLINPAAPNVELAKQQVGSAARGNAIEVAVVDAATVDELRAAIPRAKAAGVEALVVPPNGLFISVQPLLVDLAMAARVPLVFDRRSGVQAGGLASYGVSDLGTFRRAAVYIDKILKGASPGDLPIEFPTEFELAVNLKTAEALGLPIPPILLVRATDVIE